MTRYEYTGEWNWNNFSKKEVACKCGCDELWNTQLYGSDMPHWYKESMDNLQKLRDVWGKAMIINSGHRCPKHNKNVGGVSGSMHQKIAFDVRIPKEEQSRFKKLARECGFRGIGTYDTFIHIDMGKERSWNG